jgi:PAS domain S-box-containing protein
MSQPLRVLVVEDNPLDAEMLVRRLRRAGFEPDWQRVDTEAAYLAKLHEGLDIILADYAMPQFDGLRALELLKQRGLDVPFILVSAAIGEETAVAAMKQGAADYLLKDRLTRLGSAVEHALNEVRLRRERRQAEAARARAETKYRSIFENSVEGLYQSTPDGRLLIANPALARIAGYGSPVEMIANITHVEQFHVKAKDRARFGHLMRCDGVVRGFESQMKRQDGSLIWISTDARKIRDDEGNDCYEGALRDITERKQADDALRDSLREKEVLLKEVHHRVKNNLQVITSLLRLEAGQIKHPLTSAVLKEMQDRIRSMALLHETLCRTGNFARIDLGLYLKDLCGHLFRSIGKSGVVALQVDASPVSVEMDQAVSCGLIVNELASNCLKHAFPEDSPGKIRVELHTIEGGPQLRLRVTDNGVGLPEVFEFKQANSLGLQLVADLVRQLEGKLKIGGGPGASFEVIFTPKQSS